ncbi:hypothetical protein GQ53DRAFT_837252 [Thozetella sp. PMI_491]|nr:hypothetical protein GQ53DRAFT_837252 [Thozetella sp. PMI_491]
MATSEERLGVQDSAPSRLHGNHHSGTSLSTQQAWNLYLNHALMAWNAKGYEFATILFTAAAFPDNLQVPATRMAIIFFSVMVTSSSVGQWVNNSPNRLRTLSRTILLNRAATILSSCVWLVVLSQDPSDREEVSSFFKKMLFAGTVVLDVVERLSSLANSISVERDWVVTVAAPANRPYNLAHLNAVMLRINFVCRLFSVIVISRVISMRGSTRMGVFYTACTSLACLPMELYSARHVWASSKILQAPKPIPRISPTLSMGPGRHSVYVAASNMLRPFEVYFSSSVWIPSLMLALLNYSSLNWRATFITHLLNLGYSLDTITVARTLGTLVEIASTVITPIGIRYAGLALHHANPSARVVEPANDEAGTGLLEDQYDDQEDGEVGYESRVGPETEIIIGLQRLGLWAFSWFAFTLIPVFTILWLSSTADVSPAIKPTPTLIPSILLFSFLSLSRLGVETYSLTTQQLTQILVADDERARFAGAESSIVHTIELLGASSAIVFPNPSLFKWVALSSWISVVCALIGYTTWVNRQRGHMFHWDLMRQGWFFKQRRW